MQTPNLMHKALFAGLVLLGACKMMRDNSASQSDVPNWKEGVWKFVTQKELQASLDQSPGQKLLLNVYPVKRSEDVQKEDLELVVLFQDAGVREKNLGAQADNKTFEAMSSNYINYLRNRKVQKKDIPLGYYLEIDRSKLKGQAGVNICLWPRKKHKTVQYFYIANPTCPPDCDTVPKCPPACISEIQGFMLESYSFNSNQLLLDRTMRTIIDNSFAKPTDGLTKKN